MKKGIALVASLTAIPVAFAHPGHGGGIVNGLLHPVLGLDHLLAMVAVGIIGYQLGGKAMFRLPFAFVSLMLIGAFFGSTGISFPAVEFGIALSVLMLGLALALDTRVPVHYSLIVVGMFALFHGHAHGAEMPSFAQPLLYAFSFALSTVLLHLSGILVALSAQKSSTGIALLRSAGVAMALFGTMLLIGF